jgi:PQQ-dependent catabolism-associated beta-propeller protein
MRQWLIILSICAAPPSHAGEFWVSNEKDNTISIIDEATLEVTRTIEVGKRPRGIIFSKDHSLVYLCASDSNAVQVLDPATGKLLNELPSGEDPEQFALHPDNRHLYIANEDDAVTTVVDVVERKVVAQVDVGIEPEGMAVSPDGKISITTSETTNMAHWIDTATHKIVANSLVDQRPRHAEYNKDGSEVWISAEIGGTVTVFNTADQSEKGKISFEIKGVHRDKVQPVGVKLTSDGKYGFVALGPSNHVAVVDAATRQVLSYILVGRRVWHMAFNADESMLMTTNGVSGDVTVVDVQSLQPVKSIKVGRFPWGVAYKP